MKILKSQVQDEAAFRDALEKLRQAKIDHMMNGEIGTSPPSDPILDQFIKRTSTGSDTPDDFSIDCEIVNDDPPPPSAEELKVRALNELHVQEQAELNALVPPNKVRLMQMDYMRAVSVEESERTPEQQATVSNWENLQKAVREIQYAYAKREAEL